MNPSASPPAAMSKLSELLNPAPASGSQPTSPTTASSPHTQTMILDGQSRRKSSLSYVGASGSPITTRHPSLTSPGLEALADAASNTAPLASPSQTTFTHLTPFPSNPSHFGSRPSSSHTLPPFISDFAHPSSLQNGVMSNGLEQFHHPVSGERRLSNITDPSARLPPLQQSPTDVHHPQDATLPLNGILDYANGIAPELHSPTQHPSINTTILQQFDAPATSQLRQPSSEPSNPLPPTVSPAPPAQQIQVKAELPDNMLDLPQLTRRQSAQVFEGARAPVAKMESPAPNHLTGLPSGASSPLAHDNQTGTPASKPKGPPSKKRAAPKKGTAKSTAKKRKLDSDSASGTPTAQRIGTPATSRTSMTPTLKNRKQGSETRSSSVAMDPEDEEGSEEDNEAYCICRKPDDHTLMIACDGPCEDWFHVRCVQMDSVKAKLISKWYCTFLLFYHIRCKSSR